MMDQKKQLLIIFAVGLGALVMYVMIRGFSENDETRIRKIIYAAGFAVETQNFTRYSSFVSEAYHDELGRDKAKLLQEVAALFKDYKPFKVDFKQFRIHVQKDDATTEIGLKVFFRKDNDSHLYYDAGEFKVHFYREAKLWKVREVEFQDIKELFFIPNVA